MNSCATSSLENFAAWQAALSRTSKSRGQAWESDVLRTMLMHYGSCCASTSSLERRFSKMEKIWGTRLNNHSPLQLRDVLELIEPISEEQMRLIAAATRDTWCVYYPGGCRKPNSLPRIDKGLKRKGNDSSYAAFNRRREGARLQSQPGVKDVKSMKDLADEKIRLAGSWTPKMQKEQDFQRRKLVRGVGEAWVGGGLLPTERSTPEVAAVAKEHQAARAKANHDRSLADRRREARSLPTIPLDFSLGGCVFVDPGSRGAGFSDAVVNQIMRVNGMQRVDDPIDAPGGYIVAANPGDAGAVNHWVAVLAGCAEVTPDYFANAGSSGSCLCWNPAVGVKRDIWLSPEWQRDQPLWASLVKWAIRLPASRWRLRDEWNSLTYVDKQKTMKTLIGVVTSRQKAMKAFQELRHAFAPDQFLAFVQKLDVSTSGYVNAGSAPPPGRRREWN